jgi:hypothetical protein
MTKGGADKIDLPPPAFHHSVTQTIILKCHYFNCSGTLTTCPPRITSMVI